MELKEFCELNSRPFRNIMILADCSWPSEEFIPEFNILIYTNTGSANLSVNGKKYHISPRSLSFIRIDQKVSISDISDSFHAKVLVIGGDLGQELSISSVFLALFILDETPVLNVTDEYAEATSLFFGAMKRVMQFSSNPYKDECILSLLRAFYYTTGYYLNKALGFDCEQIYRLSLDNQHDKASIIASFINLVELNAKSNRRLSFYAEKLDYHPRYLSAMVKKETGLSGQEIIDQYAILAAMAKLTYTHKSIKEISNEMEFPTQSDFGKFFKRMTGKSPLEYKKSSRV
ncbi:MAG: AraC family transcriptional regulator [Bacteroidales bacterium]|nr:AraC family transcriptional regulator [Bacteroidales bacterium]